MRYSTAARSFRTEILPWRLFQRAKRLAWDPADIDFAVDRTDWLGQEERLRRGITRLATTFMIGEEAVTLDIVPLLRAVSDSGRMEETMFLTTFLADEAKHAELFRTWFDAIGESGPFDEYLTPAHEQIFDTDLPRAMARLDGDRSPEAFLDASLTYNHFVEGVLAMTGYWAWHRIFSMLGLFPGMRKGIELVQRDERRHLAYGTYLCRRIVAEHPETWSFVEKRMEELRGLGLEFVRDLGAAFFAEFRDSAAGNGQAMAEFEVLATAMMDEFTQYGEQQLARRLKAIEVARSQSVADIEHGTVEEDLESELERQ